MKALRTYFALLAIFALGHLVTACGDDSSDPGSRALGAGCQDDEDEPGDVDDGDEEDDDDGDDEGECDDD
jgi:hypothetical protein